MNPAFGNPEIPAPSRHALGFAIVCQILGSARVLPLLKVGLPSAVCGLVISIVILSSNRVFGSWPMAHISDKIGESIGFCPSLTDFNSSPAVILIALAVFICAASNHPAPTVKTGIINIVFRQTVRCLYFGNYFLMNATARLCVTCRKMTCDNLGFIAAITLAFPTSLLAHLVSSFKNDQSAESASSQINKFHNAVVLLNRAVVKLSWQSHHSNEGDVRGISLASASFQYA